MSEVQSFEPYTTMTREELLSHVQSNMSDKRYQHCLRVERKILELAKLYGVDEKAAAFVGLAHDYAKEIPVDKQQALAKEIGLPEMYHHEGSEILHGPIGAYLISNLCGVKDEALLDAIREHTIGGLQMSLLSKCLFVADAIEDGRDYPGVDVAREIAAKNIDDAVFYLLKHTLEFLLEKEVSIFPNYRIRDLHNRIHGQSHRLSPLKSICHHLYLRYFLLRSLLFQPLLLQHRQLLELAFRFYRV